MSIRELVVDEHCTTIRFRNPIAVSCLFGVALAAVTTVPAKAIDEANPDWPCVQRKVEKLTSSQLWDGPPVEDIKGWDSNREVTKMLPVLVSRRVEMEKVEQLIEKYAKSLPDAERDSNLVQLFAGVLKWTNNVRSKVVSGIEKFQRRQVARAKLLEDNGKILAELRDRQEAGEKDLEKKLEDAQKAYDWDARVYKERQESIPIACEVPIIIEQRAFNIGRAIRNHMSS